jgi:hypothetical protein
MAVRMACITGLAGNIKAVPSNKTRYYIYNAFKSIRKYSYRFGKKISREFYNQQDYAKQRNPFLYGEWFDSK